MNNIIIDKTYFVEVTVNKGSTANQIFFPTLNVLDAKVTTGISTYSVSLIPTSPSQVPLANNALLSVSYLNLMVGNTTQIWNIPMLDLMTLNAQPATGIPSNPFSVEFNNLPIIWDKSFIQIGDITTISGAQNEVYVFNVRYSDPKRN